MISRSLPDELLLEIFYKLPVKSLGRCMCVSKAWNSLIKKASFVSYHLNHQSKKNNSSSNNLLLVVERFFPDELQYSLRFDDQEFSQYAQLQQIPFGNSSSIVGSCNGLLCFFNTDHGFILCNPIIRRFIRLPEPRCCSSVYKVSFGFGFDSIRNDYKVLIITCPLYKHAVVELYSLNRNSWRTLAPPRYMLFSRDFMVSVNGIVHCIAIKRVNDHGHGRLKSFIFGFDMNNDVFKEIVLPDSLSNKVSRVEMYLVPYKLSSIAVIESKISNESTIWVMKKYGVAETWTKMFSFKRIESSVQFPRVLGFRKNGGLITNAANRLRVVVHEQESNEINFGTQGIHGGVIFSYMESLVLLDQDASDDIDSVNEFEIELEFGRMLRMTPKI